MAKHKIGKSVSKGLRRSSINAGKKAQRTAVTAERVGTAMREAFLNIQVKSSVIEVGEGCAKVKDAAAGIVDDILTLAERNVGNKPVGRGWTANLSPRTVRALTEQGVFA